MRNAKAIRDWNAFEESARRRDEEKDNDSYKTSKARGNGTHKYAKEKRPNWVKEKTWKVKGNWESSWNRMNEVRLRRTMKEDFRQTCLCGREVPKSLKRQCWVS